MSRVYFIGSGYKSCNYVRILLPMWENGWNGNKTDIVQKDKSLDVVKKEILDSDIIVFHRPEKVEFHKLAIYLKSIGKKIVFDNDDTFKLDKESPFYGLDARGISENINKKNNLIKNFITNSDLVTTTTKTLAKEYKEYNNNVVVLPNQINSDDWDEPLRNDSDKIRIGVSGSVAYTQDIKVIEEEIKWLSDRDDIELVVFGLQSEKERETNKLIEKVYKKEYEFWDSIKKEHVSWVEMKDYQETLNELRLDIMLIPRKECYFNKCKSNVKFLESAMCEIPVIASSFENAPYEEIPDDCIIRVPSGKSWKESIEALIKNKTVRMEMGKKAKEYTLKYFNIKDNAHLWADVYEELSK